MFCDNQEGWGGLGGRREVQQTMRGGGGGCGEQVYICG